MNKRKLFAVLGTVLLVLLLVAGGYLYINNKKQQLGENVVIDENAKLEIIENEPTPSFANLDLIQKNLLEGNFKEALNLTSNYVADTTNRIPQRVTVYGYCVYAATQEKLEDKAKECEQKGQELLATVSDPDEREYLSKVFSASMKFQNYVDETPIPEDKKHE